MSVATLILFMAPAIVMYCRVRVAGLPLSLEMRKT